MAGLSPLMKGKEPVRIRLNDIDEDPEIVAARETRRKGRKGADEDAAEPEVVAPAEETEEVDEAPVAPSGAARQRSRRMRQRSLPRSPWQRLTKKR